MTETSKSRYVVRCQSRATRTRESVWMVMDTLMDDVCATDLTRAGAENETYLLWQQARCDYGMSHNTDACSPSRCSARAAYSEGDNPSNGWQAPRGVPPTMAGGSADASPRQLTILALDALSVASEYQRNGNGWLYAALRQEAFTYARAAMMMECPA